MLILPDGSVFVIDNSTLDKFYSLQIFRIIRQTRKDRSWRTVGFCFEGLGT